MILVPEKDVVAQILKEKNRVETGQGAQACDCNNCTCGGNCKSPELYKVTTEYRETS